jgi:hypothetical protein
MTVPNGSEDVCLHSTVDVCSADDGFKTISGSVADRRRTPRLIENFEEMTAAQPLLPISPQSHRSEQTLLVGDYLDVGTVLESYLLGIAAPQV